MRDSSLEEFNMAMRRLLITGSAALALAVTTLSAGTQFTIGKVPYCRDDQGSQRRDRLVELARAIATAEAAAVSATGSYVPADRVPNLPAAPQGFALRVYADSKGYVLSLVNTDDPCHYALFSDERGWLYDGSAAAPQLAAVRP
jgi:hypothetical protein